MSRITHPRQNYHCSAFRRIIGFLGFLMEIPHGILPRRQVVEVLLLRPQAVPVPLPKHTSELDYHLLRRTAWLRRLKRALLLSSNDLPPISTTLLTCQVMSQLLVSKCQEDYLVSPSFSWQRQ